MGHSAERLVSPIFVATVPESVVRLVLVVARFPERVAIFPVAVAILELMTEIVPERAFCARTSVK
jgi:hypothetical protein